jgi:hypothetical protein
LVKISILRAPCHYFEGDEMSGEAEIRATGGCLCGGVAYEVRGPVRDALLCHCENCRRTHGNYSAYASARREDLVMVKNETLRWYHTDKDVTPNVQRGFCSECGASVFWDPEGYEYVYFSAGSLDQPTGIGSAGHIWLSEKGDWYEITDELPRSDESSKGRYFGTPHQ